jgi:hypothetical protein
MYTLLVQPKQPITNEQWYERFNTRIDVGSAIGVTRQHHILLEHVASESATTFDAMSAADQFETRQKAEERYLSYIFFRQSGKQHNKLKVDLQNDFTTGDDRYPKNHQLTLHLLEKYSKSIIVSPTTTSEGTSFAQQGGRFSSQKENTYDTKYWKDKECYNCNKKGHPSSHCPDKNKDDDDKSVSSKVSKATSKSSRTSKSSKTGSINKIQKKLKKSFATLTSKIEELEHEDSDISDSDDDEDEASHFQFGETTSGYQMLQTATAFHQTFEQSIAER